MSTLYLKFYGTLAPATILVTIVCVWLYYFLGSSALSVLLLFKLATDFLLWYFLSQRDEKKMYYYYNRNLSRRSLWLFSFGVDFLLFISLLALINPRPTPTL